MLKILVPVDGSECAVRALHEAIRMAKLVGDAELHVLNVQIPIVSGHARMFLNKEDVDAYYESEHKAALDSALPPLEQAGVRYLLAKRLGQYDEEIVEYARSEKCDHIYMGTRGLGAVSGLLLGSVTRKVIHQAEVPITLVK
ncbi:universal stress protein [Bordetella sp. 2513F-2]